MQALAIADEEEVEVQFRANVQDLCEAAECIVIMTRNDLSHATDLVKTIKQRTKDIEEERTRLVKPFNEGVKAINARFKAMTAPLLEAETALKGQMLRFQQAEERKAKEEGDRIEKARREAEEKARIEAEAEAKRQSEQANVDSDGVYDRPAPVVTPAPIPQVVAPVHRATVYGQSGAVSTVKKQWTFEVVDIAALAAARPDLVQVDQVKVNQEIRGRGGEIPGLRIFEKDVLAVR